MKHMTKIDINISCTHIISWSTISSNFNYLQVVADQTDLCKFIAKMKWANGRRSVKSLNRTSIYECEIWIYIKWFFESLEIFLSTNTYFILLKHNFRTHTTFQICYLLFLCKISSSFFDRLFSLNRSTASAATGFRQFLEGNAWYSTTAVRTSSISVPVLEYSQ